MKSFIISHKALWAALLIAMVARFVSVDWDAGQHLHPDERFLTMVSVAMRLAPDWSTYLSATASQLNPANLDFSFFVYGLFPLVLVKLLAVAAEMDTYGGITHVGRMTSAAFDSLTVAAIYLLATVLGRRYRWSPAIAGYAAFTYAVAVLPIQLSHFFATDTFMLSTVTWSLALLAHAMQERMRWMSYLGAAACFGLALGSKITAVYMGPLVLLFIIDGVWRHRTTHGAVRHQMTRILGLMVVFGIVAYVVLRSVYPYMFAESANFLNPHPAQSFVDNLKTLKSYDDPTGYFPPAIQWMSQDVEWVSATQPSVGRMLQTLVTSLSYGITHGVVVGFGLVATTLAIVGGRRIVMRRRFFILILGVFAGSFIVYQSLQFVKSPRYYIISYPLLAVLAGLGIESVLESSKRFGVRWARIIKGAIFLSFVLPALLLLSIYQYPHTRITASAWMYDHLPSGATLLWEYWDDPLPLLLPDNRAHGVSFVGQDFHVFDVDDEAKWMQMSLQMSRADYYVMSSNRGWGSILRAPEKYPIMSRMYRDLLNANRRHYLLCGQESAYQGLPPLTESERSSVASVCAMRLDYRLIHTVTSYPSLYYLGLPISIPDQWLDEAYTVYDHPKVMIFQRVRTP